jgi:hypothetical protein
MDFTHVELIGGVELAALVEIATTCPRGEGYSGREAWPRWRGRKTGYHALARRRCPLTERRRDGEEGAVEREVE